jgi:hypothetical protein
MAAAGHARQHDLRSARLGRDLPRLAVDHERRDPVRRRANAEIERGRQSEGGLAPDHEPYLPLRDEPRT